MTGGIYFDNVGKQFLRPNTGATQTVLNGFSFHVAPGSLVSFVGPSGVGKSTLLHLAAGLDQPDKGAIRWVGGDQQAKLAVAFQQPRLLDWLTVRENIDLVLHEHGSREKIAGVLKEVGLGDHLDSYPTSLSGGQKQRVSLARAFSVDPDVLLLDEPFSALDELTARRLRLVLQRLWLDRSPTGILVTHNMQEAVFLSDRIVVLKGQPAEIATVIDVDLPKPRNPEDPAIFDIHTRVMAALEQDTTFHSPQSQEVS